MSYKSEAEETPEMEATEHSPSFLRKAAKKAKRNSSKRKGGKKSSRRRSSAGRY